MDRQPRSFGIVPIFFLNIGDVASSESRCRRGRDEARLRLSLVWVLFGRSIRRWVQVWYRSLIESE
jgi:hypothetical protein